MAVLAIQITGNNVLHSRAREVTDFDDALSTLISDMFDTMEAAPGVGLAAPQVGVDLRVFVYNWVDDDDELWRGVAINPTLWINPIPIGPADDETEAEGCLSVPGERFALRRSEQAILSALDGAGNSFEIPATGWLARIFQHEFDHLEGVLYVDRLDHSLAKAATKAIRKSGWTDAGATWMPGVDDLDA